MLRKKLYIKLIAITIVYFFYLSASAQQQGLYSQYMMNYYLVNPASIGIENNLDIRAGYRMQWAGLTASPRNYYFSGHYALNKQHPIIEKVRGPKAYHAIGTTVTGQTTLGLLSHNTGYFSYAYHAPINSSVTFSFGTNLGFNQFNLDFDKINWGDNTTYDPSVNGTNSLKFDGAIGSWIYSDDYFIGASTFQIFQNDLNFTSNNSAAKGLLNRHFYFNGGVNFNLTDEIKFSPSVMLRHTTAATQIDANVLVKYKKTFWAGASYRKTDAFLVLIGMGFPFAQEKIPRKIGSSTRYLEITYSYDLITSKLNQASSGSHEITAALIIPKKAKISCPKFRVD